jgi:hypothetical protein
MPDQAYACAHCGITRPAAQLATIADMAGAARDVALGFARRGSSRAGATGPRIELNLAATARLDAVQGCLSTWARHIAAERGVPLP